MLWLKKTGAYTLFAVAMVALGYQIFQQEDEIQAVPDQEELRSAWACFACKEVQHMTPRERVQSQRQASKFTVGGKKASDKTSAPAGRTSFRELILRCSKCGKMELRKAGTCPSCKEPFAVKTDVKEKKCPHCGWQQARKRKSATRRRSNRG